MLKGLELFKTCILLTEQCSLNTGNALVSYGTFGDGNLESQIELNSNDSMQTNFPNFRKFLIFKPWSLGSDPELLKHPKSELEFAQIGIRSAPSIFGIRNDYGYQ